MAASSRPETAEQESAPLWTALGTGTKLTIERYLQDPNDADIPTSPAAHKYHTGRLPNGKVGDNKPRLLLMGQRRYGQRGKQTMDQR